jgi:hypothetical protein
MSDVCQDTANEIRVVGLAEFNTNAPIRLDYGLSETGPDIYLDIKSIIFFKYGRVGTIE